MKFNQMPWFMALAVMLPPVIVWVASHYWLKHRIMDIENQFANRYSERLREARNLHDTLIQGFQGLTLRMQAAMDNVSGNNETKVKMEAVLSSADELLIEGRERAKGFSAEIMYKRENKRVVLE